MNTLEKYLRMPLSLYEIGDMLTNLPTPRRRLFNLIVAVTGLTPNTVRMILSPTPNGYIPSSEIKRKIAKALRKDVNTLFPENRRQSGSIFELSSALPAKKIEFHQFIDLLSRITKAAPKTVRKWLSQNKVPKKGIRKDIARTIGVSIIQLFPEEKG